MAKSVAVNEVGGEVVVDYQDNSSRLSEADHAKLKAALERLVQAHEGEDLTVTSVPSDFAMSAVDAQRTAVERSLIVRQILIDLGVPAASVSVNKAAPVEQNEDNPTDETYGQVTTAVEA